MPAPTTASDTPQGQHNGMTVRILAALTEPRTVTDLAIALGESSVRVSNRLRDLRMRGYVERIGWGVKPHGSHPGPRPGIWRKLTDHETEARTQFEAARKVVEAAGWVLVPRRGP